MTFVRALPFLPLLLAGCASVPLPLPPPDAEVRPVVASDDLSGRWTITAVNGRPVRDYWLELGAEGPTTERQVGQAMAGRSSQSPTFGLIGCNEWRDMRWARNGDKLFLSGGHRTERGCATAGEVAREAEAAAILDLPMTMELTPPARLRLVNEAGTIDLVRTGGVG